MRAQRGLLVACVGRRLTQPLSLVLLLCLTTALYVLFIPSRHQRGDRLAQSGYLGVGRAVLDAPLTQQQQQQQEHSPRYGEIQHRVRSAASPGIDSKASAPPQTDPELLPAAQRATEQRDPAFPRPPATTDASTALGAEADDLNDGSSPRRFVLGLNFWEQLTMATNNLFKLACLAAEWRSRAVLPFTYNSRLYGLPGFKPDDNFNVSERAVNLDIIYDRDDLDRLTESIGLPAMAEFREFLTTSMRGLTVVHFIPQKFAHEVDVLKGTQLSFEESSVVYCEAHLKWFVDAILQSLTEETGDIGVPSFYIERYYCASMGHMLTPQDLAHKVGLSLRADQSSSVLIVNWRGMSDDSYFVGAKGTHSNNRILMSNVSHRVPFIPIAQHSESVLQAAKWFIQYLGLTPGGYVGVHIRSEKLGLREPQVPGNTRKCLIRTLQVVRELASAQQANSTTVFVIDYGPYSSDTCERCKGGMAASRFLSERGIVTVSFRPKEIGAPEDHGFVAAVETSMLERAKALVLCGGGAFQQQLKKRYLRRRSVRKSADVHEVCVDYRSTVQVME